MSVDYNTGTLCANGLGIAIITARSAADSSKYDTSFVTVNSPTEQELSEQIVFCFSLLAEYAIYAYLPPMEYAVVKGRINMVKIQCPCCGYYTHEVEQADYPLFEICSVCMWQYDQVGHESPDRIIGPNHVSLNQARENYKKYGICEERFIGKDLVRAPLPEEFPENNE